VRVIYLFIMKIILKVHW